MFQTILNEPNNGEVETVDVVVVIKTATTATTFNHLFYYGSGGFIGDYVSTILTSAIYICQHNQYNGRTTETDGPRTEATIVDPANYV